MSSCTPLPCARRPNTLYGVADELADWFAATTCSQSSPVPGGVGIQAHEIDDTDDEDAFLMPSMCSQPVGTVGRRSQSSQLDSPALQVMVSTMCGRPPEQPASSGKQISQPSIAPICFRLLFPARRRCSGHTRTSVDDCMLPETRSQPYAIKKALMTSTQFTGSAYDCAHQTRPTLFTSRINKTQWLPFSEKRSGFPRLLATQTMVYVSAQSRRPLQLDSQRPTAGPNAQSNNWKIWCTHASQRLRREWFANSSQTIRCCAGLSDMRQMCTTRTRSPHRAEPHMRASTARTRRRNSSSLESAYSGMCRRDPGRSSTFDGAWESTLAMPHHRISTTSHYPMGML